MNFGINAILERYDPKSYDLRGRVRVMWYFFIIIIPVLLIFLAAMNILVPKGIFQTVNIIVAMIIATILFSMLLVSRGYYNAAANILAFMVLLGLVINARANEASGSAQRFLVSEFAFIMPILFSMLFCRRWVLVVMSVLVEATIVYTVVSSPIVDPAVRGAIVASMSITVVISFIVVMMMTTLTETSKKLRAEDAESEQRVQREINESLMQSMQSVSARLDESSRVLSDDTARFAANIQEQASSIEEITATMEEITSGTEQVSAGDRRQSELMEGLLKRMNDLVTLSRDMESRITTALARTDAIAATARSGEAIIGRMDTSMSEIGTTSKEMSGILEIINDISDRINLLSLNASIEAARAGEYGRGFAVVADEIAKLADQTSSSVKEIAALITKSESEVAKGTGAVRDTIGVMREILAGVEESNRVTASVNAAMEISIGSAGEAHREVGTVKERAEEISVASAEQKTAALDVMANITGINELSQANAARSEDITGHTKDISAMAGDIKDKISSYRDGGAA